MPTAEPHPLLARVEWLLSDQMRVQIEPCLRAALRFAPPWLQSLSVRYDPNVEDLMQIGVRTEYRHANIQVGNAWFSETESERRNAVIHEMVHTHTQGMHDVYAALLEALEPPEAVKRWADEQWRRAEESAVCDLSRVLEYE